MTPGELTALWTAIARPAVDRLNGRRISGGVWGAVDDHGSWHLLVQVPAAETAVRGPSTRGLEVSTSDMVVADEAPARYIDLACTETPFRVSFAAFSSDLLTVFLGGAQPREAVLSTLARWRRFWSVPGAPLSREEALGLFGELWFLERWLGVPAGIARWTGPEGGRHDFQGIAASVEVKATRVQSDGPATHWITSLDQLAGPEVGQLYLFSLQAVPDALAANTLPGIVSRLQAALESSPDAQAALMEGLAAAGYSPAHAGYYEETWRIVAEELYEVRDDFPRIVRATFPTGVPPGVTEISYALDLTACFPWRLCTRPTDPEAASLRQSLHQGAG